MNNGNISGNLTADAEIKKVGDSNVINFSIANNDESKKLQDGTYENIVSFFNVVYWSKSGKMINHLKKGKTVSITYKLKQDRWETESGEKRNVVKLRATEVIPHVFEKTNTESVNEMPIPEPEPVDENDVPF